MLQISSAKFFESDHADKLHVTEHSGVLYTNYSFYGEQAMDSIGSFHPTARAGELNTIVCKVPERQPKLEGGPYSGEIISVAQDEHIQDFAAILSFGLNITCTPDHDLAHRLIAAQKPQLGAHALPKKYIEQMFDADVSYKIEDIEKLKLLFRDLISLDRKSYVGVIRAIRRFVTAMHRISDELDLSYSLLVASIESLAQGYDEFTPKWDDFSLDKKKAIESALNGATEDVQERVRNALLKHEHVALKRRFSEFAIRHAGPEFFRNGASSRLSPAGRTELKLALRNAYDLRSGYVHTLKPLPQNLLLIPSHADVVDSESRLYLTHNGLARLARAVIFEFIKKAPRSVRETYDYRKDFPNIVRARLATQHWLGDAERYSAQNARFYLNGFLTEVANHILDEQREFTDLRPVLEKIEQLVKPNGKSETKMPMLALHFLFSPFLPQEERAHCDAFAKPYLSLFDAPSIDSFFVHLLLGAQVPEWTIEESQQLLIQYSEQRFNKRGLNAGPLIGAAAILWVAEMQRVKGNQECARQLIGDAVEEYPQHKRLAEFEASLTDSEIPPIKWRQLLNYRSIE